MPRGSASLWLAAGLLLAAPIAVRSAAAQPPAGAQPPSPADDSEAETQPVLPPADPIKLFLSSGTAPAYTPNRWGEIRLSITNDTDEDVSVLATSYFEPDINLQYGRRFWQPARTRMGVRHPVYVGDASTTKERSLTIRTMMAREGDGEAALIRQQFGALRDEQYLRLDDRERWCGIVDDKPLGELGRIRMMDLLVSARVELNLKKTPAIIPPRLLPATREALDPFDHLLIAGNRAANDDAGLAALRSWMFAGGHVWVMLDRVDPLVLEHLLGNDFECQIVDRVGLHDIRFESAAPSLPNDGETAVHELPVDHVRVVANGFDVVYSVNGWPAAMWKHCGRGQLLVTTLGGDGWVQPLAPGYKRRRESLSTPRRALMGISSRFFARRNDVTIPKAAAEEHVRGYVGYSIPSRRMILGILVGFTALLGIVGAVLARRGRLEWLGLVAPLAGAAAGAVLIRTGYERQTSVPNKAAVVQFVEPMTGGASVSATAGVFLPDDATARLHGAHDGWALPEMSGQEGMTRRLVWTDLGKWQWENLRPSPGLRFASVYSSAPLESAAGLTATVNDAGLAGRVILPAGLVPSDGLLVSPAGRMAVDFQPDLSWTATRPLAPTEFLDARVLSDEQHRRLATLKSLLDKDSALPFPEPSLVFWTPAWDMGIEFSQTAPIEGSAMVVMPVDIDRPAAGSSFRVPGPWLAYRETTGPDGAAPGALYNNQKKVWSDRAIPTATWLRFQVPPALDPFDITSARVDLRVSGPVGRLELSGYDGEKRIPIKLWMDPIGDLTTDIDPKLLFRDERGGLFLHVSGGDPERPELTRKTIAPVESDPADSPPPPRRSRPGASAPVFEPDIVNVSYWRIESLSMELHGAVPQATDAQTALSP